MFFFLLYFSTCDAYNKKIDVFLENELFFGLIDYLDEYALKANVRIYIDTKNNIDNSYKFKKDKNVFFVWSEITANFLKDYYKIDGYKAIAFDSLVFAAHIESPILQQDIKNISLDKKIEKFASNGLMVFGKEDTSYGILCANVFSELGIYKLFDDSFIFAYNSIDALRSVVDKKGAGLVPLSFVDADDIVIIDNLDSINKKTILMYVVYSEDCSDFVNFMIDKLVGK